MKCLEEERKKKCDFSLIISLESLINQSVWGWDRVLSVTMSQVYQRFKSYTYVIGPCTKENLSKNNDTKM